MATTRYRRLLPQAGSHREEDVPDVLRTSESDTAGPHPFRAMYRKLPRKSRQERRISHAPGATCGGPVDSTWCAHLVTALLLAGGALPRRSSPPRTTVGTRIGASGGGGYRCVARTLDSDPVGRSSFGGGCGGNHARSQVASNRALAQVATVAGRSLSETCGLAASVRPRGLLLPRPKHRKGASEVTLRLSQPRFS